MYLLKQLLTPYYRPILVPIVIATACTLLFSLLQTSSDMQLKYSIYQWIFGNQWSLQYILLTPFIHSGLLHLLFNSFALIFIGGNMVMQLLSRTNLIVLMISCALFANVLNNVASNIPAIGLSGMVMGLVTYSVFHFGQNRVRLLLIHDLFKLPPFQFSNVVLTIMGIDIIGILMQWNFIAHWAHIGGAITGLTIGWYRYRRNPFKN